MTNFEKRQLAEAAENILEENKYRCDKCPAEKYCKENSSEITCRETLIIWLKSEAEEDG